VETVKVSCSQEEIHVTTGSTEGYISSVIAEESSCGQNDLRPWVITVAEGQQVNITLYDFSSNISAASDTYPQVCKVYATIRESDDRSATTVCGYIGRVTPMYVSTGNQVQIRLMRSQLGTKPRYLLHYQGRLCG
jgi:hypothetical protein